MTTNVLLQAEYRGYNVVIFASESSTVHIDNPRFGEKTYSVHVPRLLVSAMEESETLNPYLTISLASVQLLINEREKNYDT